MIKVVGLLLMAGFWLFMLYDCIRNEPDKRLWLWVLIIVNFFGAITYCFQRWIPREHFPVLKYWKNLTSSRKRRKAKVKAKSIKQAANYVNFSHHLPDELENFDQAAAANQQDFNNEDDHLQTLWNEVFIDIKNKKFTSAKSYLETILKIDPDYKYGDASLMYGETLFALQELETAKHHLENHIQNWNHPQAYIILAEILSLQGDVETARNYLETIIVKIQESSYFHYKRKRLVSKAAKLLRTIKR
ncbi:PLD nuclease N-terminal domain-containing protein [Nostoc sp. FACHB-280]|uniref:PLD nuclease N-terminal domain-containing protein n=1 Tax=Nostoc sp. FACHB-280 TaxID=2692839 RepID=UPI00168ABA79|nr:PLD nuclease N-terminal domain-containing protein [Nostoc sp. FACHB-280]MBD2494654.1 PLDc N-terminal domain-containing protein [Nostoc sp. FACHB-280]